MIPEHELRTTILTPTGKDGRLIAGMLERVGMSSYVAASIADAARSILDGAGAAIISEEAFAGKSIRPLVDALQNQPSWSDFPLILLTVGGQVTAQSERLRHFRLPLGNVLLLERPIRPETLLSTLELALRGRQRQYQIRDQLQQYALAQKALLQSEKLAVTGRLAASIAHEINNPLESVTNLVYLMRGELSRLELNQGDVNLEKLRNYLADTEQELQRVTEITKQTLRFYREPSQPSSTEVASVFDSILTLYGSRLNAAGISVQLEIRAQPATVLSTPGELRQVLANIVGNASDAMRHGGPLRIRVSEHEHWKGGGRSVRLSIADKGCGIAPDVLPHIFEPFVTTKGETGTGLGLWVTSEIIKKNGWTIRVRTCQKPGRSGTVFSIVIPKLETAESRAAQAA